MTAADIDGLYNQINHGPLPFFKKLNTSQGLDKVLLGQVPTWGEINLLEDAFGPDFARAVLKKRPAGEKAWDTVMDLINLPRSVMSSMDISFPLRQGLLLIGEPKEFSAMWMPMLKAFGKESWAQEAYRAIDASQYRGLMERSGLEVQGIRESTTGAGRSEQFASSLATKIPILGYGIRASDRAFTVAGDVLRSRVFEKYAREWEGVERTPKDYEDLARFLNAATGRTTLPKKMEGWAPVLNAAFFSPRYFASRIETPAMLFAPGTSPVVRKIIAKDLVAFVGSGLTALALAKMAGAEVEPDPRSSDFGKMRFGNTRYDFWAGYQPIARYTAQLMTGQWKSVGTGQIGEAKWQDTLGTFLRSKLAPAPAMANDVRLGKDFQGDPVTFQTEVTKLAPLFFQDLQASIEDDRVGGFFKGLPAVAGVGIQTFATKEATTPGLAVYEQRFTLGARLAAKGDERARGLLEQYSKADGRTPEGRQMKADLKTQLGDDAMLTEFNRAVGQISDGLRRDNPALDSYLTEQKGLAPLASPTPTRTPTPTPTDRQRALQDRRGLRQEYLGTPPATPTRTPGPNYYDQICRTPTGR